jgi:tetratricopeptide (TPR) repeat protein
MLWFRGTRVFNAILLFLLAASQCHAADSTQSWSFPHFSDDAAGLYRAAAAVSSPPGSQILVLEDENSFRFDADGRCVHTKYILYKFLAQDVSGGWNAMGLGWEPWHEDRPAVRIRVITPDFAVHPLDPKSITDSPAVDDDPDVYGDARVIRAPLPAIEIGSLVEEEDMWTDTKPAFDAGVVIRLYFGRSGILVQNTRLVLDAPLAVPLRYQMQLLPEVSPLREEANGWVKLTFDFGPIQPLDRPEPYLPNDVAPFPNLTFSTGSSWQAVAESYEKTVDRQIARADIRSLVSGLIDGKKSREEQLTAILGYLGREVRYTGVEFADAAIVPGSPTETLRRKYGDCKDKATLLVAMLRAAGIPSNLALLSVGNRHDLDPNLPGMGLFDHALVYVPGAPALWVDATDRYARLGEVPSADQGRLALVVAPATAALRSIPVASAEENLLVEKREIYLSQNGPARVVETSLPRGYLESVYRADYADPQNKETNKDLTDYLRYQYLAEKLDRAERSDPSDLSKQFSLVIEADRAKRGYTDLTSATVAIRFDTLFSRLPSELLEREKENGGDLKDDSANRKKRTADYELPSAFVTEWQYSIFPPVGFRPRALPSDAKMNLGPAVLIESFSAGADGVVHAKIRFELPHRLLTIAEAALLREKVAEVRDGDAISIYFDPLGQTLLAQGKFRQAIQAYRDLVVAYPNEAVHHLQIAKTLLAIGMGETARSEARIAVKLEPNSALAEKTLAEILEYDVVGRERRPGSDYAGAEAAYRAAEKLDPDDKATVANLAILLEYNQWGLRYGLGAKLRDAIAEYQKLTPDELNALGIPANPAFAMFYAGQFSEALEQAENLGSKPKALIVACQAVLNGSEAAFSEARKLSGGEDESKQIEVTAGEMLANIRNYPLAADLLNAGATGDKASENVADAHLYRMTKPHEQLVFPADAVGAAGRFFLAANDLDLTVERLHPLCSRNGTVALATTEFVKDLVETQRRTFSSKSRRGLFPEVGVDISIAREQPKAEGDDFSGFKITLWPGASYKLGVYVLKEDGQYKILATSLAPAGIGLEVLDRLASGNLAGARVLLDWARDDWHLVGGDDPIADDPFPRLWTRGKVPDPETMKLAAAAMLTGTKATAAKGVSVLEQERTSINDEGERMNLELGLVLGYDVLQEPDKAYAASEDLAQAFPGSSRIFFLRTADLRRLGRFEEADRLAEERLQRIPGDLDAMRALSLDALTSGNFARVQSIGQKIIDSGQAQEFDLNNISWDALFVGKVTDSDVALALKAVELSSNKGNALHTLGCLYAELGQTEKARGVFLQAMDLATLDEPDDDYWYAFGRIAEQYGERETAIADYSRLAKPSVEIPGSTYQLAQDRLQALRASAP